MKYLKKFENHTQYESYIATDFAKPNVSYCVTEGDVHYNPIPHDYSEDYLTFVALESGTFTLTIGSAVSQSILSSISYSTDGGETWNTTNNVNSQTVTITTPTISEGEKVLWKGSGTGVSTTINNSNRPSTSSIFSSSGEFNVEGNIMSLIYGDDFSDEDSVEGTYNFALLFYSYNMPDTAKVVSAKNMVLPIDNVTTCCYFRMFQSCPLLEEAPSSIDATSIGASGCMSTFWTCPSLTTAPELPATTLSDLSYKAMFEGCSALTKSPSVISASSIGISACNTMFSGCTSLTTAPELPATTLANYCYQTMFNGCTSLTTAPELPATTLGRGCYQNMFKGCTSLTTAPELPAETLANECYVSMFYGCISLETAPELPATTLANNCYSSMFYNCSSLTTAPELPATTLANNCYSYMFYNCSSLTAAPELPATTLTNSCYTYMFYGCTSLTTAPVLPATTLAPSCYNYMFNGCTSLNYIKAMFTTTPSNSYTSSWVSGVSDTGTFVKNAAATWTTTGNNGIPTGWTVETASE